MYTFRAPIGCLILDLGVISQWFRSSHMGRYTVNKQNGDCTIEHVFSEAVCRPCMAGVIDLNSNCLGVNATARVRQFDEDLYAIIL